MAADPMSGATRRTADWGRRVGGECVSDGDGGDVSPAKGEDCLVGSRMGDSMDGETAEVCDGSMDGETVVVCDDSMDGETVEVCDNGMDGETVVVCEDGDAVVPYTALAVAGRCGVVTGGELVCDSRRRLSVSRQRTRSIPEEHTWARRTTTQMEQ